MAASLLRSYTHVMTFTSLLCLFLAACFVWQSQTRRLSAVLMSTVVLPALTFILVYTTVMGSALLLIALVFNVGSKALGNLTDHIDQYGHWNRRRDTWSNGNGGRVVLWPGEEDEEEDEEEEEENVDVDRRENDDRAADARTGYDLNRHRRDTWNNGTGGRFLWPDDGDDEDEENVDRAADIRTGYDYRREHIWREDHYRGDVDGVRVDNFRREDYYRREANNNYRTEQLRMEDNYRRPVIRARDDRQRREQENRRQAARVEEEEDPVAWEAVGIGAFPVRVLLRLWNARRSSAMAA